MNEQKSAIVLPVFTDRETTEQFNKHTLELADKLYDTINAWLKHFHTVAPENRPSAYAVGAACYAALWKLSEDVSGEHRDAMLSGCATTLLKNDTKFQLAIAELPPTPN